MKTAKLEQRYKIYCVSPVRTLVTLADLEKHCRDKDDKWERRQEERVESKNLVNGKLVPRVDGVKDFETPVHVFCRYVTLPSGAIPIKYELGDEDNEPSFYYLLPDTDDVGKGV